MTFYFCSFQYNSKTYKAHVAFQVYVKGGSYKVGPETVLEEDKKDYIFDPKFSNDELEWYTNQQGSTVLYGLLIKVVEK